MVFFNNDFNGESKDRTIGSVCKSKPESQFDLRQLQPQGNDFRLDWDILNIKLLCIDVVTGLGLEAMIF